MKKKIVGILILISIIFSIIIYNFDNNNTFTKKSINYNGNNLKISIDGNTSSILPTSGIYYLADYDCKNPNTKLTWDKINHKLNISNNTKGGGVSCNLDFQSQPLLSSMEVGSYVSYVGNNGCSGESCNGQNANYESEDRMGYCYDESTQFITTGWRIGYIENGSAYLVSAGSPECMCTDATGESSTNTSCSSYYSGDMTVHQKNLNEIALKYCNPEFIRNGICDENNVNAMNGIDVAKILNIPIDEDSTICASCYGKLSDKSCGYNNDLIDNGSCYWINELLPYDEYMYIWLPTTLTSRSTSKHKSSTLLGVRPVLALDSSVIVTGGTGTYEDPYTITNNTFQVVSTNDNYINDKSNIELSLIASSNVSTMCINVDSSGCSNYIDFSNTYTLDLSSEEDGQKIIYVYYKDSDGNIVSSVNKKIILDTVAPTNNSVTIKDGQGLTRTLNIHSTGANYMCLSNTSSDINDCTEWVNFKNNYTWRLSEGTGTKSVYVFLKDKAGNTTSTTTQTTVDSIVEFIVNEDFSDTTYDSNITITGDTYPWQISSERLESTNKGVNSSVSTTTISFTPTVQSILSFDYGVSSENNYDKLLITLTNGDSNTKTLVNNISGTKEGSITDINLTEGITYTLTLSYKKDNSGAKNDDIAYIDNLIIQS